MTTIFLDLVIIDGQQKRKLECYIDSRFFRQRKTYDEYYVDTETAEFELHINDLMILAEDFDIRVLNNGIQIRDK